MIRRSLILVLISIFACADLVEFNWRLEEGWMSLSIFDELSQVEGDLTVMWWNIDCTSARNADYDRDPENVFHNLEVLVESDQKPDILILGENCPRNFSHETFKKITAAYGGEDNRVDLYHTIGLSGILYERARASAQEQTDFGRICKQAGRNVVHRNGLRVFHSPGIKINSKVRTLPGGNFTEWAEIKNCSEKHRILPEARIARDRARDQTACERKHLDDFLVETSQQMNLRKEFVREFWDRRYLDLHVTLESGKEVQIVAVHLAQPWKQFVKCSSSKEDGAIAALGLIENIDSESPTNIQIRALADQLGSVHNDLPRIVIGDWNYPSSMEQGFSSLEALFGSSVVRETKGLVSYYPPQRSALGELNLDHAFVSGPIKDVFGRLLPMAGAEHLPIYTVYEFE